MPNGLSKIISFLKFLAELNSECTLKIAVLFLVEGNKVVVWRTEN